MTSEQYADLVMVQALASGSVKRDVLVSHFTKARDEALEEAAGIAFATGKHLEDAGREGAEAIGSAIRDELFNRTLKNKES